jgi:transcriptional regulator with XRE-family HTH domain
MFILHKIKLCAIIIVKGDVIMTFGETLKRLRQRNNISQDELAKKLNVKQYVISSWEIGRSEPNIEQIKFLSTYFNVPTDYLLGKDIIIVSDEKEFKIVTNHFKHDINDDVINEVIKLLKELNEKDKNKIAKIIKDTIELLK